jgi:gluconate 2-dehydrogenase gamma chain
MPGIRRRDVLAGTALVLADIELARAAVISGQFPWQPDKESAPPRAKAGTWEFFTPAEAATMAVLADRIIPPDPDTPGGNDAGCVVFIDRQLAGAYGQSEGLYERPPFNKGTEQQGPQSAQTPAQLYRQGISALDRYCLVPSARSGGQPLTSLQAPQQDAILHGLEDGSIELQGVDAKTFLQQVVKDVQQGFFADPIYGGNRDMCAWKMIGFPGARYDYRDWVSRHNERYPHPPVSIGGRIEWTPRKS